MFETCDCDSNNSSGIGGVVADFTVALVIALVVIVILAVFNVILYTKLRKAKRYIIVCFTQFLNKMFLMYGNWQY